MHRHKNKINQSWALFIHLMQYKSDQFIYFDLDMHQNKGIIAQKLELISIN